MGARLLEHFAAPVKRQNVPRRGLADTVGNEPVGAALHALEQSSCDMRASPVATAAPGHGRPWLSPGEKLSFPSLTIDVVPALLVFVVLCSTILIVLSAYLRRAATHRQLWSAGTLAFAVGMLAIIARGHIPDVASILLGNLLVIAGYIGFAAGTSRFAGGGVTLCFAAGAAAALVFAVAYLEGADIDTRVVLISLFSLVGCVMVVSSFLRVQHWAAMLGAVLFGINGVLAILRLCGVLGVIDVPGGVGLLHALVLNYAIAVAVGLTMALIVLNARVMQPVPAGMPAVPPAAEPDLPDGWQLLQARSALVSPNGTEVRLTGSEYLLLRELGQQQSPVMRGALHAAIGRDPENPKDRSIDILISRLRRKCAELGIELPVTSVRGLGYVFRGHMRQNDG